MSWIIACEDLGSAGDFDFNDVVFKVSHVANSDKVTIIPLAAGGNLGSVIKYNNAPIAENAEIHHLLNPNITQGEKGAYPFINTEETKGTPGNPITLTVDKNFSITHHDFSITTEQTGDSQAITSGVAKGKAPMMLCLPGDWIWPKEYVCISDAYPAFASWVKDTNATDWYETSVKENLVK